MKNDVTDVEDTIAHDGGMDAGLSCPKPCLDIIMPKTAGTMKWIFFRNNLSYAHAINNLSENYEQELNAAISRSCL